MGFRILCRKSEMLSGSVLARVQGLGDLKLKIKK
ncbi:MAG: hypothetical protein C5S47_03335 [Candidatus Methanogasteraceae archaeon]|nr:MAG: hypothetical protein C5S47_03335 [ANME-2 cluster archaeon]